MKQITDSLLKEFGMTPIELNPNRKMYCKAHGDYVPFKDFVPDEEVCVGCYEDEGRGLETLSDRENHLIATC